METLIVKVEIGGETAYNKKPPSRTRRRKQRRGKNTQKITSSTGLAKSGEIGTPYTTMSDVKLQAALVPCTALIPPAAASELLSDRNSIAITLPA